MKNNCPYRPGAPCSGPEKDAQKKLVIAPASKYLFSLVASREDMINGIWEFDS